MAGGGAAVCPNGQAFPCLLFDTWLSMLQRCGSKLPFIYTAENWQTVLEGGRPGQQQRLPALCTVARLPALQQGRWLSLSKNPPALL